MVGETDVNERRLDENDLQEYDGPEENESKEPIEPERPPVREPEVQERRVYEVGTTPPVYARPTEITFNQTDNEGYKHA